MKAAENRVGDYVVTVTNPMLVQKRGAIVRNAFLSLVVLVATLVPAVRPLANAPAPVYVTLWFDTEDYILPQDDDATKRLAELLTRLDASDVQDRRREGARARAARPEPM